MNIFDSINTSPLYEVVGDGFVCLDKSMLEDSLYHNAFRNYPERTVVGVNGRSSIGSIFSFLSAIYYNRVPVMVPFKTSKIKDGIIEERYTHFKKLGIGEVQADDEIAFVQLSSGTTGNQKGFGISHESIIEHCKVYAKRIGLNHDSVIVSWLPLTHDMGLITSLFLPLVVGCTSIIIPTERWVMNYPSILDLIHEKKATHVWFPNFCFELLSRFPNKDFDFSQTTFFNCSEPTKADSVKRFKDNFGRTTVYSCYAMAENVFAVTQADSDKTYKGFLSSGKPIDGVELVMRDDEICFKGKFLYNKILRSGQWESPKSDVYETGDIGIIKYGELFVLGRKKDIAIVRGKNILLTDLDLEVSQLDQVHSGRVASVAIDKDGTQELVILYEGAVNCDLLIKNRVMKLFKVGCRPYRIQTKSIIKTTSGKVAREKNKNLFEKRKKALMMIKAFLHNEEIYDKIDEETCLKSFGLLDSLQIFNLISQFHIVLDVEIDWSKDYSHLDSVGSFIDEFIK